MVNTPVVLRNASDAYVSEKKPRKNISKTRRLYMAEWDSVHTRYAYIYFARPFPMGARIVSATLRLRAGTGFDGSVTMSVQRVANKWSVNRINWNNKPALTGPAVTTTKVDGNETKWAFDVTELMQSVSDGAAWYGFRIHASGTSGKWITSAQGYTGNRPTLEISWSDEPEAPEELYPDGGLAVSQSLPKLRFDFTDNVGNTDMAGAQVGLSSDGFNTVYWLQEFDTSVPEADLVELGAPALANGATAYWRVRVKDGSGAWSEWSDIAHFRRVDPAAVTITNPPAGGAPFVSEPTPPITWTLSLPQRAYQVIVTTPETPENWIWTSGKVTSSDNGIELPPGIITRKDEVYRVIVRAWDNVDRIATPGALVYRESFRDFTYAFSDTVEPVDTMHVAKDQFRAWAVVEWTRSTAPDSFVLLRDGKVVEPVLDPADVVYGSVGGTYRFVDKEARSRVQHTWEVVSVVNGISSKNNPTDTETVRQITTSLVEIGGPREMYFLNPGVDAERAEISEIQYILGDAPPVLITQSIRGYEGVVSGVFANDVVPGLTARQQHDALEYFMRRPGTVLLLTWVDRAMKVVIRNVTLSPISRVDGTVEYEAKFEFFQVDF